ncbi:MAG: SpoIIE family protein phosphatase, partial [Gammaproteobacteria bacterium]|nr:SpoIIE family protein phosphatase [Gammaproteobacteria bacterium]
LVLISDGITDAESPDGVFYGRQRVTAMLEALPPFASGDGIASPAEQVLRALVDDVAAHTLDAAQSDDTTVLVLAFHPRSR